MRSHGDRITIAHERMVEFVDYVREQDGHRQDPTVHHAAIFTLYRPSTETLDVEVLLVGRATADAALGELGDLLRSPAGVDLSPSMEGLVVAVVAVSDYGKVRIFYAVRDNVVHRWASNATDPVEEPGLDDKTLSWRPMTQARLDAMKIPETKWSARRSKKRA